MCESVLALSDVTAVRLRFVSEAGPRSRSGSGPIRASASIRGLLDAGKVKSRVKVCLQPAGSGDTKSDIALPSVTELAAVVCRCMGIYAYVRVPIWNVTTGAAAACEVGRTVRRLCTCVFCVRTRVRMGDVLGEEQLSCLGLDVDCSGFYC